MLGLFFMLFGARIRGQGARVRLGWCARSVCAALRKLSRRKQNECGLYYLPTIISPRRRRKSLKVEPPNRSINLFGGSAYFICLGSSMRPNI